MTERIKLTRAELYQKNREQPTVKLAAEFGLSEIGLGKICRRMNVPKPPLGYWRRFETGAKIEQTPLPKVADKTSQSVHLYRPFLCKFINNC